MTNYDPHSGKQISFHRTDPTGRINPLVSKPDTDYGWLYVVACFAAIVLACVLREM